MRSNPPRARWALLIFSLGCSAADRQPDGGQPRVAPSDAPSVDPPSSAPPPGPASAPTALPGPRGARACSVFDERGSASTGDWSAWSGCACTPDAQRLRDRDRCGMFPCAEAGCYVQPCKADGDCAIGICASFLGRPRGYCVTDDPK